MIEINDCHYDSGSISGSSGIIGTFGISGSVLIPQVKIKGRDSWCTLHSIRNRLVVEISDPIILSSRGRYFISKRKIEGFRLK